MAPQRDLDIQWKSISLLFKNEPAEDSDYYAPVLATHKMLRVFESVQATDGNEAAGRLYYELGLRIHNDGERDFEAFDLAGVLAAAEVSADHLAAADDESWDARIRAAMDDGLGLVGSDVGTPIIAFENESGVRNGIFGPVISTRPQGDAALKLWDGMAACMDIDGFWELKRTRTEGPNFEPRP